MFEKIGEVGEADFGGVALAESLGEFGRGFGSVAEEIEVDGAAVEERFDVDELSVDAAFFEPGFAGGESFVATTLEAGGEEFVFRGGDAEEIAVDCGCAGKGGVSFDGGEELADLEPACGAENDALAVARAKGVGGPKAADLAKLSYAHVAVGHGMASRGLGH